MKPLASSTANVIFSGAHLPANAPLSPDASAADLLAGNDGSEGGFELPNRLVGRAPPGAKDASPAGALFSGERF